MAILSTDPMAVISSFARVHRPVPPDPEPEPFELRPVRVRCVPLFLQEVDYDALESRSGLVAHEP